MNQLVVKRGYTVLNLGRKIVKLLRVGDAAFSDDAANGWDAGVRISRAMTTPTYLAMTRSSHNS